MAKGATPKPSSPPRTGHLGKGGSVYDKFRKRLIFPVIDVRGDVVASAGGIVDKNDPGAKYMNSPETIIYSKRRVLYGLNLAKKIKRENIILVEGNIDVVMLHQAGFDNACASMGTALTTEQIRLLSRYTKELILCYDNDNAGRIATQKALELLNDTDFSVRVLELPNRIVDGQPVKQDADDFIRIRARRLAAAAQQARETGMDFRMARLAAGFDLTSDQGRIDYAAAAADLLAELPNAGGAEITPAPRRPQASRPTPSSWKCSAASSAAATASGGAGKARPQRRRAGPAKGARHPLRQSPLRHGGGGRAAAPLHGRQRVRRCAAAAGGGIFLSPARTPALARLWQQRQESGRISPPRRELPRAGELSPLPPIIAEAGVAENAPQASAIASASFRKNKKRSGAGLDPLPPPPKNKAQLGHGGKQYG